MTLKMSKRILLCEDDTSIVDVTNTILDELGYTVEVCTHSEEVLKRVKITRPDLILLDLWMPHLDGAEITRRLKADPKTKTIPVVILSANKDTEAVAKEIGADSFLCKPFDIDVFEKKIKEFVE